MCRMYEWFSWICKRHKSMLCELCVSAALQTSTNPPDLCPDLVFSYVAHHYSHDPTTCSVTTTPLDGAVVKLIQP